MEINELFMQEAIIEAKKAEAIDEVPVGAIIVKDGVIIARSYNLRETSFDPTAHAEINVLRLAAKALGGWRLTGCTLYVTLEPCPMCAGAIINARMDSVIFGAFDKKAGCCGTLYNLPEDNRFNHCTGVTGGVLEAECSALLSAYFKKKRAQSIEV